MALSLRINAALSRRVDPAVRAFAATLAQEAGALAVLFYGSNLRTGSREGVLDFYVLLPGDAESGMWPKVSYREWNCEGHTFRAKIATLTLAKFSDAAAGKSRDTTIWARFVQPSALVWSEGEASTQGVADAVRAASVTAAKLAIAVGPERGKEGEFWRALFRATYKAELRVEKPGRENSILELNAAHFDGLLPDALEAAGIGFARESDLIIPHVSGAAKQKILDWWRPRQRFGKALNIARLLRATRTFEGAGRYAAWKVERHTGVKVEVTPWRERHPVLAAPGVLLKVWRAKRRAD